MRFCGCKALHNYGEELEEIWKCMLEKDNSD